MNLLLLVLSAIVFFIIVIFVTQMLWNYVTPDLFGFKEITFFQTAALIILISLLFGGHCNNVSNMYK